MEKTFYVEELELEYNKDLKINLFLFIIWVQNI